MKIRKFWLTNKSGTTYYLTNLSSRALLNEPQGLGYSNTITSIQYPDALSISEAQNFPQFAGEVVFFGQTNEQKYADYQSFISFLSEGGLVLNYQIPSVNDDVYTMDVVVSSIAKTEVGTDNVMRCPLVLQSTSRWKGEPVTVTGSGATYTLTNNGHMPVGFEITMTGALGSPYITLTQDSEVYGMAKVTEIVDSLYLNSIDGEQDLELVQGGSTLPNPLAYQDLSISNGSAYVTFMKLNRGQSTLTIGLDSGSITSVEITFTPMYRSV